MPKPTKQPGVMGRPRKPIEDLLLPVSIRLKPVHAEKLRLMGRDWLIARLDKATPRAVK